MGKKIYVDRKETCINTTWKDCAYAVTLSYSKYLFKSLVMGKGIYFTKYFKNLWIVKAIHDFNFDNVYYEVVYFLL